MKLLHPSCQLVYLQEIEKMRVHSVQEIIYGVAEIEVDTQTDIKIANVRHIYFYQAECDRMLSSQAKITFNR